MSCSCCDDYGPNYKDIKRGAVDAEDFYKEVNYSPKSKKKKKPKKYPGCPENEGKAHVYVWTSEYEKANLFSRYFGYPKFERQFCAGCKKVGKTRHTEKYEARKNIEYNKRYKPVISRGNGPVTRKWKRGNPYIPSYNFWFWESNHEGFCEYRRDYIAKHGWSDLVYRDIFG